MLNSVKKHYNNVQSKIDLISAEIDMSRKQPSVHSQKWTQGKSYALTLVVMGYNQEAR